MSEVWAYRFVVGDPNGKRSVSWKIWLDTKGDTYIAQREDKEEFKASLHQSGKSHVSISERAWRKQISDSFATARSSRFFSQCNTKFLIEGKSCRLYHIIVASEDLVENVKIKGDPANLHWISDPGEGKQVEVLVHVGPTSSDRRYPTHKQYSTELLAFFDLLDIRISVVMYTRPYSAFKNQKDLARSVAEALDKSGMPIGHIKGDYMMVVMFNSDEGIPGERFLCGKSIRKIVQQN